MSGLSSLKYLDLSGVDLHKQVDWIQVMSTLPSISELRFENCQIDSIIPPKGQTNFTYLQFLDLSNNRLSQEIPPWLSNFSAALVQLELRSNFLQERIPQMISDLQKLENLVLQGNQISGIIPNSLGQHLKLWISAIILSLVQFPHYLQIYHP